MFTYPLLLNLICSFLFNILFYTNKNTKLKINRQKVISNTYPLFSIERKLFEPTYSKQSSWQAVKSYTANAQAGNRSKTPNRTTKYTNYHKQHNKSKTSKSSNTNGKKTEQRGTRNRRNNTRARKARQSLILLSWSIDDSVVGIQYILK